MGKEKEYEIVQHTMMNHLEVLIVEMTSRNPHGHSDLEIGTVIEGSLELILDQKHIKLEKNDVYVINRYQIHSFTGKGKESLVLAFQINSEFYKNLSSDQNRFQFRSIIRNADAGHDRLHSNLMECAGSYYSQKPFFEIKCASLLFDSLYLLAGMEGSRIISDKEYAMTRSSTLRLNRILEYMAEHYAEPVRLEDLADAEHITSYHVSHFIKKALGISFQEYLNNLRFEQAYRLVTQTSFNIFEICMECGFSSSRYLNQMFLKRTGCRALDLRKQKITSELENTVLPIKNIQKRLSFEQSKNLFQEYSGAGASGLLEPAESGGS
ncbi:MAG TPA: AraC family transcriptional regulator [Lachnospiraceae bacterium]|nr:AraC family transcriptional regulator [Lachnospiraceae bacterium]